MLDRDRSKNVGRHRAEVTNRSSGSLPRSIVTAALGVTLALGVTGFSIPNNSERIAESIPTAFSSNASSSIDFNNSVERASVKNKSDVKVDEEEINQVVMKSLRGGSPKTVIVPDDAKFTIQTASVTSKPKPGPTKAEKRAIAKAKKAKADARKKAALAKENAEKLKNANPYDVAILPKNDEPKTIPASDQVPEHGSIGKADDKPTTLTDDERQNALITAAGVKISKWVNPIPGARISSHYGHRGAIASAGTSAGLHNGVDLASPYGTSIHAAFDGKVVHVGANDFDTHTGGIVVVLHQTAAGDFLTSYNHMKTSEILVEVGDDVESGETIARVGAEGFATGPHLHFSVREVTGSDPLTDWEITEPEEFMNDRGVHLGN